MAAAALSVLGACQSQPGSKDQGGAGPDEPSRIVDPNEQFRQQELTRQRERAETYASRTGLPLSEYRVSDTSVVSEQYAVVSLPRDGNRRLFMTNLSSDQFTVVLIDKEAKVVGAARLAVANSIPHSLDRLFTDFKAMGGSPENSTAWLQPGRSASDVGLVELSSQLRERGVAATQQFPKPDPNNIIGHIVVSPQEQTPQVLLPNDVFSNLGSENYQDGAIVRLVAALHPGDIAAGVRNSWDTYRVRPDSGTAYGLPTAVPQRELPSVFVNEFALGGGAGNPVQAIGTYGVTSCVAVGLWDPDTKKGALVHFRSNADAVKSLDLVTRELRSAGAETDNLHVAIAGGDNARYRGEVLSEAIRAGIHSWCRENSVTVVQDTGMLTNPWCDLQFSFEDGRMYAHDPDRTRDWRIPRALAPQRLNLLD